MLSSIEQKNAAQPIPRIQETSVKDSLWVNPLWSVKVILSLIFDVVIIVSLKFRIKKHEEIL